MAKSSNTKEPVEIVTLDEAKKAEKSKSKNRKTWIFEAENVRDFAGLLLENLFGMLCLN
jgi:hypothetical protein